MLQGRKSAFKDEDWKTLENFLDAVTTLVNELKTNMIAINAKLDLDGGVTDTDYASLHDPASTSLDTINTT